jgi:dTMP kinase
MAAAFFSLDGLDGTGKSTQVRLLAEWLRGKGLCVVTCFDPGGTPLGQELRELVLYGQHKLTPTCEALLFMASRAQLVTEIIRPALTEGNVVISDRFTLANVVYQGHAGGLSPDELWQVGRLATGGLSPSLTLVLDLPPEAARARRGRPRDRVEGRPKDYHARVRQGFLREAARCPDRIKVIDASPPVEVVQEALRREVSAFLGLA